MHIQPVSLSLSGFLSYDKPQEFLFPTTPGPMTNHKSFFFISLTRSQRN